MKLDLDPSSPRAARGSKDSKRSRAPIAKKGARWEGAVEGIHKGLLYGWAIDKENPQSRVVLEICLNDEPVGTVIADVARTDLLDQFGSDDPCHGFVAEVGEVDSDGALSARVANTDVELKGKLPWKSKQKPPLPAVSYVFSDGGLQLHGWALDPTQERAQLEISAYLGDRRVASTIANLEHPALRDYRLGRHGFILSLPLELADGQLHSLRIVDQHGNQLGGSPIKLSMNAEGLRSLIKPDSPQLATDVISSYEQYLPRCLGFQHYAAWSAMFNRPEDVPANSTLSVAIVVAGGTAEELARTAASIAAQTHSKHKLYAAADDASFAKLLKTAIGDNHDVLMTVRPGDTLLPHALAAALEGFGLPGAQLVYADTEFAGQPWLKPAWNPDYAYASDYVLDGLLVRAVLIDKRALPASAAQLAWQAIAKVSANAADAIIHVPRVLYRLHTAPSAAERAERFSACAEALAMLEPACDLTELEDAALPLFNPRRVHRPLSRTERNIAVSLIIPTRDSADLLKRCINSLLKYTKWRNLEIIVIDNGSLEAKTKTYFRALAKEGIRVLPMPGPFNFADLNNRAVQEASGEVIGLINNDIEALHNGWLDEIISQLLRPGIGAVGAKLLWPNGMVQHGGVLMGVGNAAGHFGNLLLDGDPGYHGRNQVTQQVSGVTAACLLMRKRDYLAVGGMDPIAYPVAFNDVDLCLRLRNANYLITWTPFARLIHAESASRGKEDSAQKQARAKRELKNLREQWAVLLQNDPAYHPSLNLDPHSGAFRGLAIPPRTRTPRNGSLALPLVGSVKLGPSHASSDVNRKTLSRVEYGTSPHERLP